MSARLALAAAVAAALLGGTQAPTVQVSLIPEFVVLAPEHPFRVAVRLQVPEGWHIYWKRPGQSGLPTTVAWQVPPQIVADSVSWPAPERLDSAGVVTHVYRGDVILVAHLRVVRDAASGTVDLAAQMGWGICREICIPQERRVVLSLPIERRPQASPRWPDIERTALPRLPASPPLLHITAVASAGVTLTVRAGPDDALSVRRAVYFPADSGLPAAVVLQARITPGGVLFTLPPVRGSRLKGVLVCAEGARWPGGSQALAIDVPIGPRVPTQR